MAMKKTLFYNFLSSKQEELECIEEKTTKKVSKVVVEIRDNHFPPRFNLLYPWKIIKRLINFEVFTGKFVISYGDTLNHIFRYFDINMANHVVSGNKAPVIVRDVSWRSFSKTYSGANVYFEMLPHGDYALTCKNIIENHLLRVGDEIGFFIDPVHLCFVFKVLSKAI